MIPISQIDPELSIYKENTVVIWGAGKFGREILSLLQKFSVKVSYFCDSNPKLWKTEIEGVPVILPQELMKMHLEQSQKKGEILVQIAMMPQYEVQVTPQVEAMGLEKVIFYQEAWQMLWYYFKCDRFMENQALLEYQLKQERIGDVTNKANISQHILKNRDNLGIIVCMPGKTGDHTILNTLKKHHVRRVQTHSSETINKTFFQNTTSVKIITAIREPIFRRVSQIYEEISRIGNLRLSGKLYLSKRNDAQTFFDSYAERDIKVNHKSPNKNWFNAFSQEVADVLAHPFDQEKGYTIIKEGNIEVFFYQLEKLNDLVPELSEWVGVPFTELVMGNEASSKWIAKSYKQAQKELKFSQEYFDMAYNDPHVQHCYSQADIEKFKERWRGNIDPNK